MTLEQLERLSKQRLTMQASGKHSIFVTFLRSNKVPFGRENRQSADLDGRLAREIEARLAFHPVFKHRGLNLVTGLFEIRPVLQRDGCNKRGRRRNCGGCRQSALAVGMRTDCRMERPLTRST